MARRKGNAAETLPDEGEQLDDAEPIDRDEDCRIDGGIDGSFTLSRRRRAPGERADRDADDLPDEPPPGWCDP